MRINGKILEIKETQQISDTFKKRMFVVEYAENIQYPEYITFELVQDRCTLIDGFQIGQEVEVSYNLKGRKWTNPEGETRYFNTLQAWRIEALGKEKFQSIDQDSPIQQAPEIASDIEDDLPF